VGFVGIANGTALSSHPPSLSSGLEEAQAVAEAIAASRRSDPDELGSELRLLLLALRGRGFCLFCGALFDSQDQLREQCPGLLEEDH